MTDWFTGKVAYLSARLGLTVGSSLAGTFPTAVNRLSDWLAGVGFYIFAGFRNRSVDNIRIALSPFVDRPAAANMARQSLRNFFRASVEIAIFMSVSDEDFRRKIAIEGREYLDAALAKGKGVMILSAHLGNFFLAGTRLAVEGFPTYVLVNQPRDGKFAQLMDDYRLRVRQKTIHARPRRQALRDLNAVLRNNQIAVIIADEYRSGNGIEVPLFGRAVIARRGPATLALRTGAAVVPASMIRQPDDTLKLVIEPELELDRSGRGKTQIAENTLRITQWLERTVRKYPDQWNWMNIRWCEGQDREPIAEPHHLKQAS